MTAPVVTPWAPPPLNHHDPWNLRPAAVVAWTGASGPFTVLHEWDTDSLFGSPLQDSNAGATSPDTGIPPADLGPAGTTWFYRVTVTNSLAEASTSSVFTLVWTEAIAKRRFLYLLANIGVSFDPTDVTTPGPADDPYAPDGFTLDFNRYLYLLTNAGVGFDPTDTPGAGWGPAPGSAGADGFTLDFNRYLYLLVGDVNTDTPTPHIWYVFPTFGREGWEFLIVGYGFGDTQGTYSGTVTLNGLAVGIISWELIAQTSANLTIDPVANIAEPIHQLIKGEVPIGATSGLVVVCTDGP